MASQADEKMHSKAADPRQRLQCLIVSTRETHDCSTCTPSTTCSSDALQFCPAAMYLSMCYPGYEWETWNECCLVVDAELGAGLILQATHLGYLVDQVEEKPGQDSTLQPGTMIVCINSCSLAGLEETELETIFGRYFSNGAKLSLLQWSEFCAAEIQQEAAALGEWHEADENVGDDGVSHVVSPFLRNEEGPGVLRMTLSGNVPVNATLRTDFATLEERFGLSFYCSLQDNVAITVRGDTSDIRAALGKLEKLVWQYGLALLVDDELFIEMPRNEGDRRLLTEDLRILGQRFGIEAELCCPPHTDDSIVLSGDTESMRGSIDEFGRVLDFHGVLPVINNRSQYLAACSKEDTLHEAEDLEMTTDHHDMFC